MKPHWLLGTGSEGGGLGDSIAYLLELANYFRVTTQRKALEGLIGRGTAGDVGVARLGATLDSGATLRSEGSSELESRAKVFCRVVRGFPAIAPQFCRTATSIRRLQDGRKFPRSWPSQVPKCIGSL